MNEIFASPPRTTLLAGGLPLVVVPRPGPRVLAARLVMRGGSGADPRHGRGAHQLLAGLMTRGCGELDAEALADLVEGAGAALRSEASEDALTVALHCGAEDADRLLPLLLAMVRQPTLDPDQLELERQLNLQTLQRQREDPSQLAYDQLRRLLFNDGPYGHDPLGVEADLEGLERSLLLPLLAGLGTRGAVITLCGDAPAGVEELLERTLEAMPWTVGAPSAGKAVPSRPPSERLAGLDEETEQLVILLGAPTVPWGHPDALALRLLQAHLGAGMSCRLFQTLREARGLAYDVGVHLPARCGPAPFVVHLSTSAERAEEATTCLLEEWQAPLEEVISAEALTLALAKYRGQDAMGRQTCSQLAERLALVLSHGLPADQLELQLERAARLTPEDLRDAAGRWLRTPSLSLVGPAAALEASGAAWSHHPLSAPAPSPLPRG
ncbi:MAG: insulinase family protein [Cyanobacteria bacterium K_Offshore_surface_m2_239]|nr:insulinase family protein [Cyanobacteria bacterium K_Offshore_surface_m2_239]